MPMRYTEIFKAVKNENFQWKFLDIFLIFAQNIDSGYSLEPPRRGIRNKNSKQTKKKQTKKKTNKKKKQQTNRGALE